MNRFKLKRAILQRFLLTKRARIRKLQRCCIGKGIFKNLKVNI